MYIKYKNFIIISQILDQMIKKKTEETAEPDYLNTRCKQGKTVLLLLTETIKIVFVHWKKINMIYIYRYISEN